LILSSRKEGYQMSRRVSFRASVLTWIFLLAMVTCLGLLVMVPGVRSQSTNTDPAADNAVQLVTVGRQIFRFDTFGDQACLALGLSSTEKSDLIQYLLSLTFGSQNSGKPSGKSASSRMNVR
jgi:hypothetical protein